MKVAGTTRFHGIVVAAATSLALLLLTLMGACATTGDGGSTKLSKNHRVGDYHNHGLARVNWTVARQVYDTAAAEGIAPDDKIMVALFSATLVETECNNLTHQGKKNDHDSEGVLQQRPSKGWGSSKQVRDVPHATRAFVHKAKRIAKAHPGVSPGDLAQSVQISGYGGRYALRIDDAKAMIKKLKKK